jgi:uncharacterized protein YndB with AHSA1/START domain
MTDTSTSTPATGADMPETGELTITRVHRAPIELVFDCMTTPEHLTHFWGPTGTSTPVDKITVDLRPGGRFETTMVSDADGSEYTMVAEYVEVDRPTKLVWREPGVEGGMLTTVTFRSLDDGSTEATTHQTNVPAMFLAPEARAGFETSLDRFDVYLDTLTT